MSQKVIPEGALPCIWMGAGLITYHLCDRAYECETCPLDTALRGECPRPPRFRFVEPTGDGLRFPDDRQYTDGHLWLQRAGEGGRKRLGIDALAAALLPCPAGMVWDRGDGTTDRALCVLELSGGTVSLGAALGAVDLSPNPSLTEQPGLAVSDPYEEGWLADITLDDSAPSGLMDAEKAEERARHDLRHFRRRIALHLLSDTWGLGPTLADGGTRLTDIRQMVGSRELLDVLRDLVH